MSRTIAIVLLFVVPLFGCGAESPTGEARAGIREVVAVASAPAELLASVTVNPADLQRIGDEWKADWSPTDEDLRAIVTARRVMLMGNEFEPWAQRAGLPPSRTIELSEGLSADDMLFTATVTHTHGEGPAHNHGGVVPTTWTDPALLRAMIHGAGELLAGALAVEDSPAAADAAVQRRLALEEQLKDYESALEELKAGLAGRRLFATAHGLEYVARAVDAELQVTLLEAGPDGKRNDHAAALLEAAAEEPGHAGVLVWLGSVDEEFAEMASTELGLKSVAFDLGRGGSGATVLSRLAASVRAVKGAVSGG
jgi:ABC-type Zn uptake system ZnuABC Zn-binding protein ZnuA